MAEFLREKGSAINSRVLSALAVRVAEDPFVKVKKMIKDLIVRLMEEANEEAEHKGWCRAFAFQRRSQQSSSHVLHSRFHECRFPISDVLF